MSRRCFDHRRRSRLRSRFHLGIGKAERISRRDMSVFLFFWMIFLVFQDVKFHRFREDGLKSFLRRSLKQWSLWRVKVEKSAAEWMCCFVGVGFAFPGGIDDIDFFESKRLSYHSFEVPGDALADLMNFFQTLASGNVETAVVLIFKSKAGVEVRVHVFKLTLHLDFTSFNCLTALWRLEGNTSYDINFLANAHKSGYLWVKSRDVWRQATTSFKSDGAFWGFARSVPWLHV